MNTLAIQKMYYCFEYIFVRQKMYLSCFEYIFVRHTCIADGDYVRKPVKYHILYCEDVHSITCLFYVWIYCLIP